VFLSKDNINKKIFKKKISNTRHNIVQLSFYNSLPFKAHYEAWINQQSVVYLTNLKKQIIQRIEEVFLSLFNIQLNAIHRISFIFLEPLVLQLTHHRSKKPSEANTATNSPPPSQSIQSPPHLTSSQEVPVSHKSLLTTSSTSTENDLLFD